MKPTMPATLRSVTLVVSILLSTFVPMAIGQANVQGQWSTLSYTMPINPIHAALLHNNKILVVTGSGNCPPSQSRLPIGSPLWSVEWLGSTSSRPCSRNHHPVLGQLGHVLQRHDRSARWTRIHQWRHNKLQSLSRVR